MTSVIDMNETTTIILSIFGGAALTGLIGLAVFILTGRREHKRWMYDLRYEKYLEALKVWQQWLRTVESMRTGQADLAKAEHSYIRMSELISADLLLVSSPTVEKKFTKLLEALQNHANNDSAPSEVNYDVQTESLEWIHAMRSDLKIKGTLTNGL